MKSIREILIERDEMLPEEADELIEEAREEFSRLLMSGRDEGDLWEFCGDWFGLEPDYLEELF